MMVMLLLLLPPLEEVNQSDRCQSSHFFVFTEI